MHPSSPRIRHPGLGRLRQLCPLAVLGMLLLPPAATADDAATALQQALEAGADDAVLAPLYLQAGDDLLRRSELNRAADAFEQALNRGAARLPANERLRLAQHLAWAGRLERAIAALRDVLAEQPDNLEARLNLARYLSWRGLLVEAGLQADRVLSQDPGNRTARQVKANAASWRGDSRTSQPLYRELLAEQDDFETRLNYTQDLLATGRVVEARASRARLTADTDKQRTQLANLDARIARHRPPRLLAGITRYTDSDDNRRREYKLGGGISAGNLEFSAEFEQLDARDRLGSIDARRARLAAVWPATDGLKLRAAVGAATVDDGATDDYAIGYLGATGALGRLWFDLELERDLIDEIAAILRNRIRSTQLEAVASLQFDDRWRFDADLEFNDYSDDNQGWQVQLTPQYALRVGNPGLRLGYRRVQGGYDRQSGGGYFDPSRLQGDQLVLFGTLFGQRLRGDFELYAGQQETKRFGVRQRDQILGGSARLAFEFTRHLSLETELEGGNFSLQSSGGFNYVLWSLNLIGFF